LADCFCRTCLNEKHETKEANIPIPVVIP
jgi:hypothetical protein